MALGVQQYLSAARRAHLMSIKLYDQHDHLAIAKAIAQEVPSLGRQKVQTISWLDAFPLLNEWVNDERIVQRVFANEISVTSKAYEITYELDKIEQELNGDIQVGSIERLAEHFGNGMAMGQAHHSYQPLRINATTYDGAAMFSASHKHPDDVTFDNIVDLSDLSIARGSTGVPTIAEARRELDYAVRRLMANSLRRSTIVEIKPTPAVVVVVKSQGTLQGYSSLLLDEELSTGVSNPWRGKFRLMWDNSPVSGDEKKVDVISAEPGGPRPAIFINLRKYDGIHVGAEASDRLKKKVPFGADAIMGFGAGFPQSAVRIQE